LDRAHTLRAEVVGVHVPGLEFGIRGLVGENTALCEERIRAAMEGAIGSDVKIALEV